MATKPEKQAAKPEKQSPALERRAHSIDETAKICGLSRATLYRLIAEGRLATVKVLGRRLVRPEAIDALLREGA